MRKFSFSIFGILFGLIGFFYSTNAQAITVSPLRLELNADPGVTVQSKFKIYNDSEQRQTFYVNFANFQTNDETGTPAFVPGKNGIPSWATAEKSVQINAKQYSEVEFSITPPIGTDPGGYFAAIFASTSAPSVDSDVNVAVVAEAGTLILFRVNGDLSSGEKILEYNTKNKKKIFNGLPVEFYYRFQNSGKDYVKPVGDITIKSIFGWTSKTINANPTGGAALPLSIRKFEASWSTSGGGIEVQPIEPQRIKENASFREAVTWQWQHFALGLYKAKVHLTVNNDTSRTYESSTMFWVLPWQLITVIIGALLVMGIPTLILITVIIILRRKGKKQSSND